MTPVFAHGRLRLYLLSLLEESPKHGYEIIQALSERFGGTYSPSAGTIYPRLSKLEEEGLVTKSSDGRKTVYEITEAGRAELAARQSDLRDIETEMSDSVRRLADEVRSGVNAAMRSLRADLAAAARDAKTGARSSDEERATDAGAPADESDSRSATTSSSGSHAAGWDWRGTWEAATSWVEGEAARFEREGRHERTESGASTSSSSSSSSSSESSSSSSSSSETVAEGSPSADARTASRRALRDAELALSQFRADLTAELRTHAAKAELTDATVSELRARLDALRAEVRGRLRP